MSKNRKQSSSRVVRRTGSQGQNKRRLRFEPLEDRRLLVVGTFDIPAGVMPGSAYDGVADVGIATGALLSTGRHILTAAHVGAQNTGLGSGSSPKFSLLDAQGNPTSITKAGTIRKPPPTPRKPVITPTAAPLAMVTSQLRTG